MRQKAIIIDIDGTIAKTPGPDAAKLPNGAVDWDSWIELTRFAPVNEWCKAIVDNFADKGFKIIFLTARRDGIKYRSVTEQWLNNHFSTIDYKLIMRERNDFRDDYLMKRDAYLKHISLQYDTVFAIDDKFVNVEMFRQVGIPALHCEHY